MCVICYIICISTTVVIANYYYFNIITLMIFFWFYKLLKELLILHAPATLSTFSCLVLYKSFFFSFNLSHTILLAQWLILYCQNVGNSNQTTNKNLYRPCIYLHHSLIMNISCGMQTYATIIRRFFSSSSPWKKGRKRQKMKYQPITPTIIGRRKQVIYIINNIDHIQEEEPTSKRMFF